MPIDASYLRKLIPEERWPEWVDEFFDLDLLYLLKKPGVTRCENLGKT